MKFLQTILASLFLSAAAAQANLTVAKEGAEVGKWTQDFDAAKKIAGEKKLPMLVNFTGSDWCHWCKIMDEQVFAKDAWKTYAAENAVLVTVDFPNDKSIVPEKFVARNAKLREQFGVQGYPTYVVLDSDGESQIGQLGAGKDKTPESFIKEFKLATKLSASSVEAYVKANPDKADDFKAAIAERKASIKALEDWIETGPEQNEENNKKYAEFQERIKKAVEKLDSF